MGRAMSAFGSKADHLRDIVGCPPMTITGLNVRRWCNEPQLLNRILFYAGTEH